MLKDLTNSNEGKIILSIIWGLGLASLFRQVCKGRNCIVIEGPKPKEMENKIYDFEGKCYKYKVKNVRCKKK